MTTTVKANPNNQKLMYLSAALAVSFILALIFLILFGVTLTKRKNFETNSAKQPPLVSDYVKDNRVFQNYRGVQQSQAIYGNSFAPDMKDGEEATTCDYDPSTITLSKGENVICYPYLGVNFFLHIYVPTTYKNNDIMVVAPGRAGNGYQYIAEVLPIAEMVNSVFVTPDWEIPGKFTTVYTDPGGEVFSKYMYFFGGVFPNSEWDIANSVVAPDSSLNDQSLWWYNFWTEQYKVVKELLNLDDSIGWIFYGDDAGGIPVMGYAAFWYNNIPKEDRPRKLIVGVCSFYLTMVWPMLKTSYLEDVDKGQCFAGEITKLMNFPGVDYTPAKSSIEQIFSQVTDENAYMKSFEVMNEASYWIGQAHNTNITEKFAELHTTSDENHIWGTFDMTKQLPFPYGLGNITEALGVDVEEIIFNYTNTPLTIMQTSVDTNPWGGVTKPHYGSYVPDDDEVIDSHDDNYVFEYQPYHCTDAPGLLNNQFSIPQGPYRLARNTNFYYSGRYYQTYERGNTVYSQNIISQNPHMKLYEWDYVTCPGVGHNSIGEAHCLGAYLSVWDNVTETRDAMVNANMESQLFYNISSNYTIEQYGTAVSCQSGSAHNDTGDGTIILYDDDVQALNDYEEEGYFPTSTS